MRVVVTGATGNVGTSVLAALAAEPAVTSIVGLARRLPARQVDKTEWVDADVRYDDLVTHFRGADVVVHLAWLFQPTHRPLVTWRANVIGSARVLRAVADAKVPALVYASSLGAYSPKQDDHPVDETWPTDGWPPAGYMREKAYVERLLDLFVTEHPHCRAVRLRPAFIFQRAAASEQRRLFAGPLLPNWLLRPGLIPVVPAMPGLCFQALHAADAADAFRRAVIGDAEGAFNLAADPVIDAHRLAELLHARTIRVPTRLARAALATAWHLRLAPADPNLFDGLLRMPIMGTTRARTELGWTPRISATDAIREALDGMREGAGADTPPLAPDAGGPFRVREFASGVGGFDPVDRWGR
ncbi:NAD-dependent epimerase/dehydratase family protein [Nocardia iowensis]|uniref:NAD-dependent epimerase/dehydratase family protein n=1 Tax=Nocardia iowensis TaxID=204891 RepID=A0ABX8S2P6_NOCIO|nr:NAD-dependent epimerase/dehydratase family protein [Nocardia iowensis]QXN94895.1 NAD-dependent epimerase/dehydratase family protein [Nocardia iowensis]